MTAICKTRQWVQIFEWLYQILASPRLAETACLIADINMPVMTGLELHRRLIDSDRAIPTILVTAFPNDVDKARGLTDGVVLTWASHLTKSVSPNAFAKP